MMPNNEREKKARLDMPKALYDNILEYSDQKSLGGSTKGHRVLIAINEMYNSIISDDLENTVLLTDENRKALNSFQNFGLLSDASLSDAINDVVKTFIKEHKEDLQQKISEL
jgi:hypothetical protein